MRQIFTSARLENVEGVAKLLREHGVETRITRGRSYSGKRRRGFSYRNNVQDAPPQAVLWVIFPDDQTKAREVLREAGLMETTRDSYLPQATTPAPPAKSPKQVAARVRLGLLIAVVLLASITSMRTCQKPTPAPLIPEPATTPQVDPEPESHIIPVDTSLL